MDADQLRDLGLEREPFSEDRAGEFFFSTPALSQRLDLLHHLVQYSDLLLVVAAPEGAGRSSLVEQVIIGAGDSWRICMVDADRCFDARALIDQLIAALGVETDEDDANERTMMVRANLESASRDGQISVIVIDDAELMSREAMVAMVELAAHSERLKARFIVVCDPDFALTIGEAAAKLGAGELVYGVEVPSLSAEQTGDYIHTRLHTAGLVGDSPFTGAVIRSIFSASAGLPGRINAIAVRVLENHAAMRRSGAGHRLTLRDLLVWSKWLSAASVALLLLVVVVVVLPPSSPEVTTPLGAEDAAANPAPPAAPAGATSRRDAAPAATPDDTAESVIVPVDEAIGGQTRPRSSPAPRPEPAVAPPETTAGEAPETITVPARDPLPAPEAPAARPAREAAAPPAGTAAPPEPAGRDAPADSAPTEPPVVSPGASPPDSIRDITWLRAQLPTHYTIQLIGTRSESAMRRFIRINRLGAKAAWYPATHRGRPWFAVVYGLYPTRDAARRAVATLPPRLRKGKPWIRRISTILRSTSAGR